jgi:biopolymer transport protein ExbD
MLRFPAKKRKSPTIHLTALIDIVFLLLIFFLLASNFVKQEGLAIIVPEIESEGSDTLPEIVVDINQEGTVSFRGITVNEHQLIAVLKAQLNSTGKTTVVIRADRRVQYNVVVQAIDAAKLAGAENLLLVTKRELF